MYAPGPNVRAEAVECELPLPSRVPEEPFSFSDHEAVSATIRLTRGSRKDMRSGPEFCRENSLRYRQSCVDAVGEALDIVRRAQDHAEKDELRYAFIAAILLILLVVSFVPIALLDSPYHAIIEVGLFFPRFAITLGMVFFTLMATLFNKKEKNALSSTKTSLELIRDQDILGLDLEDGTRQGRSLS